MDSNKQTLSLPAGKVDELLVLLQAWRYRKQRFKAELQSLLSSLQFAAKCVLAGRLFTRRMIRLLAPKSPQCEKSHEKILCVTNLPLIFCVGWNFYLNGTVLPVFPNWNGPDRTMERFTDASGRIGLDAYFGCRWFQAEWHSSSKSLCIEVLSIIPIYLAIPA